MADFVQTIMVIDNNFSAINTNNVFFLQAAEYAADRFYGEAEEIADIHSQWQTQTFEVAICA